MSCSRTILAGALTALALALTACGGSEAPQKADQPKIDQTPAREWQAYMRDAYADRAATIPMGDGSVGDALSILTRAPMAWAEADGRGSILVLETVPRQSPTVAEKACTMLAYEAANAEGLQSFDDVLL